MPQVVSTSPHNPSAPPRCRLIEAAGHEVSGPPDEVARHLRAGGFFWLDLDAEDVSKRVKAALIFVAETPTSPVA